MVHQVTHRLLSRRRRESYPQLLNGDWWSWRPGARLEYMAAQLPHELVTLITAQSGVVSRQQASEMGLQPHDIKRLRRRRAWRAVYDGVYVNHTGPLTSSQRVWAAVLRYAPAAVCGPTALALHTRTPLAVSEAVHLMISDQRRVTPPPGIEVTRRRDMSIVRWDRQPPQVRFEDAVLQSAFQVSSPSDQVEVLAKAVRSRRTTAWRLLEAFAHWPKAPGRRWLTTVLGEVASGVHSVLEREYLYRVERPHGLPLSKRQVRTELGGAITHKDVKYRWLVVELDGWQFHSTATQRDHDLDRDLDLALAGEQSVRLGHEHVVVRSCETAAKVGTLLARLGWEGEPHGCGPGCGLGQADVA